jgi:hypothetical protein
MRVCHSHRVGAVDGIVVVLLSDQQIEAMESAELAYRVKLNIQREAPAQQPGPIHSQRALLCRLHPRRCQSRPARLFRLLLCPYLRESEDESATAQLR